MKILHTSDWHIGKKLNGRELEDEHLLFFEWLLNVVDKEQIDIIIVAGDIFDLAYPSNASLKMYYNVLQRLQQSSCKHVFVIGGNHDSISTLEAPKDLLSNFNIHVYSGISDNLNNHIFEICDDKGNLELVVAAIPYLRDKDIRNSVPGEDYDERIAAMRNGIREFYSEVARKTEKYINKVPVICTGHLFFSGGVSSDSERELNIGTLEQVKISELPDFEYFALGHLHRPQILSGNTHIRYSGSPIQLSFSERSDKKEVVIIATNKTKDLNIEARKVPVFRELLLIKGRFEEVENALKNINSKAELKPRISIEFIEDAFVPGFESVIQDLFEKFPNLEIISYKILFRNQITGADEIVEKHESLKDLEVTDVFGRMLDKAGIEEQEEMAKTFKELISWMNEAKND